MKERLDSASHQECLAIRLQLSWQQINMESLGGRLTMPQFAFDESTTRFGAWEAATRTITLSFELMLGATWADVERTLRHEIAHQIVSELFDADGTRPHGSLFASACDMLGIAPEARGEMSPEQQKLRARIKKLMALGTSDNPHEAEAAMAAANRLLLEHNIELQSSELRGDYEWRRIGEPTGRLTLERRLLGTILGKYFFVDCVWMRTFRVDNLKSASILEAIGTRDNLDLAEYTHAYLLRTLDVLWKDYRRTHGGGRKERNDYRVGVLYGFLDHLKSQQKGHAQAGLVWTGDPRLEELKANRFPRLGKMRAARVRLSGAHDAGQSAGRQLRIRPGLKTERTSRDRLLPS